MIFTLYLVSKIGSTSSLASGSLHYRKVTNFSDARKLCCNQPKIQEKRLNLWVFRLKDTKWNSKQWRP